MYSVFLQFHSLWLQWQPHRQLVVRRATQALAGRNTAAEISKLSMKVARDKAEALMTDTSELEQLERQQRKLRELREHQQQAQQAAQSAAKPRRKPSPQPSGGPLPPPPSSDKCLQNSGRA
jgi:hypothetical protein